ncbi:type II secretion system protein B [Paucimonas lemoignei]|uniref:Type II secretion system protein B n=1 Tax=Paucimonas lemoignei TaxID=29443 RepID=A0A4R3HUB4_PAULE|nr:general secretion pathway protein GspB [Paucimonas lemoignei]TCS35751.1 type II secretion system protein B [Paucimonas lemoignei]
MSLILDALKKAEAERHLGQIPSLHAQPLAILSPDGASSSKKKIWLGLAALLIIGAIGVLAWPRPWHKPVLVEEDRIAQKDFTGASIALATPSASLPAHDVPASPPQQIIAAKPQPETSPPSAKPTTPPKKVTPLPSRSPSADSVASPAAAKKTTPGQHRHAESAVPAKTAQAAATASVAPTAAADSASAEKKSISMPRQAALQAQAATSTAAALRPEAPPAPEISALSLRELPEQIQRELPNLAIGGYIYSDNPRERQLLVNRRLLHEGEEAAPGVILEKMTPKAAVFNYRGYRYRMGY